MNSEFAEVVDEVKSENNDEKMTAGCECGEDGCEKVLFELDHSRNSQIETAGRHPDAPESELVCIHHGIMQRT